MTKISKNSVTYNILRDQLKKNQLYPVYIICGDDDYLIEQSIIDIKLKIEALVTELEYLSYYSDSSKIPEILDTANSIGLFSSSKLIVIKQCEKLQKIDTDNLINYLNNPNKQTYMILVFENLKKFKTPPGDNFISVSIPSDSKNIILKVKKEAEMQGYKIKNDAIQRLTELVGENLIDLLSEIKKLAINQRGEVIEKSDVENYIRKSKFKDVFELINAICNKDKKKAYEILTELQQNGEEPIAVINRISWRIRQLWQVNQLTDEKKSREQILKTLKISSGNLYYIQKQIKNFEKEEYIRILNTIYEADLKLKSTQIPRYDVLTSSVIEMCK
jgi:DNA polymerase-3 subunit delta